MRTNWRLAANLLFYFFLVIFLSGLQTSLWPLLIWGVPAPLMWVFPILHFAFFRSFRSGLVLCYGMSWILSGFTAMTFAMISLILLTLFFTARFIKARIFWPGTSYFMFAGMLTALFIPLVHFIASRIAESNPVSQVSILATVFEAIAAPLVAVPLTHLFQWFDRVSIPEIANSMEGTV